MLPKALKNQSEHIPNSIAHKNAQLENAKLALEKAKALNRPVRKADKNECDFTRERTMDIQQRESKIIKREDGMITATEAKILYGVSGFNIQDKRKKGAIQFKKESGKYYYNPTEIKNLKKDKSHD